MLADENLFDLIVSKKSKVNFIELVVGISHHREPILSVAMTFLSLDAYLYLLLCCLFHFCIIIDLYDDSLQRAMLEQRKCSIDFP